MEQPRWLWYLRGWVALIAIGGVLVAVPASFAFLDTLTWREAKRLLAPFVVTVVAALIGGAFLHAKLSAPEMFALRTEYRLYKEELSQLELAFVVVKPITVHIGNDCALPYREPIEAVINGTKCRVGDYLTSTLSVYSICDQGSFQTTYDTKFEFIRVGSFTFRGSALVDEWSVTLGIRPDIRAYEGIRDRVFFTLTTTRARYEDGSDASLAGYRASAGG